MAVNKVLYGQTTLIDLTQDTISSEFLAQGFTAHNKAGQLITGSLYTVPMTPIEYDFRYGYIDNGTWKYENPTNTYIDMYEVQQNQTYLISLGKNVGSRFRAMFTTERISLLSTTNVTGNTIINKNNPSKFQNVSYTAPSDGYILVSKDNVGKSGIKTYVFNLQKWI